MVDEEKHEESTGQLRLEHYAPEDTPTIFSDGAFVIHTGNEFVISFYQTQYPPISDEVKPQSNVVKSKCIVRIVMTPFQMHRFVDALKSNLEKAEVKKQRQVDQ
jgi:hypothetical protein